RPSQVVESPTCDLGAGRRLPPSALETRFGPGLAIGVDQNYRAATWRGVEHAAQFIGNRHRNISSRLSLADLNDLPVVGRPRQFEQITLTLPGVDRQHHRQPQVRRRDLEEATYVLVRPNLVYPSAVIEFTPPPRTGSC